MFLEAVLPWSLCQIRCKGEAEELHRGRQRFEASGEHPAIDVVIPAHEKDQHVLQRAVAGAWLHVVGVRRVVVVSRSRLCAEAEFFDEGRFPFNLTTIVDMIGQAPASPPGWYLQQLIKLYAPLVIPDLTEHVLVLDADTLLARPTRWLEQGAGRNRML